MSHLAISLLGTFQVSLGSACITDFESNKVRALLAYLAVESDRPHTRDALAGLLWPESSQEAALGSLRNALSALRRAIGDHETDPPYLIINRETVQFNPASDSHLDVADIVCQPLSGDVDLTIRQRRIRVVAGYRGPFLEGFSIPDSSAFEEWTSLWRERLEQRALEGLRWLTNDAEASGANSAALEYAHRMVAIDPWLEESHCQVMRLLALSGQREQAIRQYFALQEILKRELEVEPSQSTIRLYKDILAGSISAAPAAPRLPHNLPIQTTSFIGREKETETLTQVISSGQTRLVTVTGAGGTGKTRLALQAAEELLDAFPQGVWLVQLGALTDPALVPATVAKALNLVEAPDRTAFQMLLDYLRTRRVLLILDTCEHLVGAVANLADQILRSSSQVVFLATSREILGVEGEMAFHCPPLAVPEPGLPHLCPTEEGRDVLASCESVRLLMERSALAAPGFVLSVTNAPIVAQVCRRLEGIPLAIELAAARMRSLSIEQIAERLDHAFLLLTSGSRTALPRQQTLRATIDWSYNLLAPLERALLLRLAIFSGGWTLEAAETICGGDDGAANLPTEAILDLLGRLVDKSLVLAETRAGMEPRYHMLDTVRQYGHDLLLEAGGEAVLCDRHLEFFCQLAEQAEPHLRAKGGADWMNRLEMELPNLRLALEWSLCTSVERGLRLASALFMYWHIRGRRFEGIQWLARLLEADDCEMGDERVRSIPGRIARIKALVAAGDLNHYYPGIYRENSRTQKKEAKAILLELGEPGRKYLPHLLFHTAACEEDLQNCLAIAREIGDELYIAEALRVLRDFLIERGEIAQALAYAQENLAIRQKIGDLDGEGFALHLLADLALIQGNPERALELWKESQGCFHAIGNREFGLGLSIFQARIAFIQGDYRRALELSEAVLAAGQEISSSIVVTDAVGVVCWTLWGMGAYDEVQKRCSEALGLDWENSRPTGCDSLFYVFGRVALSQGEYARSRVYLKRSTTTAVPERYLGMQSLGIIAAALGQARRAAVIFGALQKRCPWLGNFSAPIERSEYEHALQEARAALGDEAFQAAWAEGLALSREEMSAVVLEG